MDKFLSHTRSGAVIIADVLLVLVWIACVVGHFIEGNQIKGVVVLLIPILPAAIGFVSSVFWD